MAPLWLSATVENLRRSGRRAPRRRTAIPRVERLEDRLQLSGGSADPGAQALKQIDHFVVIYQENWSFDGLYGKFPGANGLANATDASGNLLVPQVDKNGNVLTTLPNP